MFFTKWQISRRRILVTSALIILCACIMTLTVRRQKLITLAVVKDTTPIQPKNQFERDQVSYNSPNRPFEFYGARKKPYKRQNTLNATESVPRGAYFLKNMKDHQNEHRPVNTLSEDLWQYFDFAYGMRKMTKEDIVRCAKDSVSHGHIAFVGDSITRGSFDALMERFGEEPVNGDNNQVPHDDQEKTVEVKGGVTLSFRFLTGVTTGRRAVDITHSLVNPKKINGTRHAPVGAIIYNSAVWDLGGVAQRQGTWVLDGKLQFGDPALMDTKVLTRYTSAMARFALAVEKMVPSDVQLLWRLATPLDIDRVKMIGGPRGKFFSNLKLRLFDRVAEDVLRPLGFEIVDPSPIWDAALDHHSDYVVRKLWTDDGMHPPKVVLEMLLDLALNVLCGRHLMGPWGRDGLELLAAL